MASTQRTASGKWTSRIYIGLKDGKKQYKRFTADTKKEAERLAQTYKVNQPEHKHGLELTVREAMDAYIAAKSNVLSPSTIDGYLKVKKLWLQSIKNIKLCDLTKEQIQYAINLDAATLSSKTVHNAYGFLTASLRFKGYKDFEDITLPQKKKPKITIPTDAELKLLCERAKKYGIDLEVHFAAYMGFRRSEISAIDPAQDIDLNTKTINIDKALVRAHTGENVLKDTKTTSSERVIAIPKFMYPLVEDAVQSGRKMKKPNYIQKSFCALRDELGLKHITFHTLRHYYASTLVILGIPNFYAVRLMGHGSDDMLKRVYQHVRQDYLDDAASKIDTFYTSKIAKDD